MKKNMWRDKVREREADSWGDYKLFRTPLSFCSTILCVCVFLSLCVSVSVSVSVCLCLQLFLRLCLSVCPLPSLPSPPSLSLALTHAHEHARARRRPRHRRPGDHDTIWPGQPASGWPAGAGADGPSSLRDRT